MRRLPKLSSNRQDGVALAVALILLVILTLLALGGMRMSGLELRMSGNDQLRVEAFEQAQSLVDGSIRTFSNTPVLASSVSICARTSTNPPCTDTRIVLPSNFQNDLTAGLVNVIITGIPPLNAKPPVGTGFSLSDFNAAYMRVSGQYDKNSLGLGAATVNEGLAIVYAAPGDVVTESNVNALSGT